MDIDKVNFALNQPYMSTEKKPDKQVLVFASMC